MDAKKAVKTISETMELQNKFNMMVNPNWIKAGYNWRRAIWVECAELLDIVGYKWWKDTNKSSYDKKQALLEVVDIYHFMVSEAIISRKSSIDMYNAYLWSTKHTNARTKELKLKQVEEYVADVLDGQQIITGFFQLMLALDIQLEDVLKYYMGKNALNKFRQDNGYKTGTYQKQWYYNGKLVEDNVVLESILENVDVVSYDIVYEDLKTIYNTMSHSDPDQSAL